MGENVKSIDTEEKMKVLTASLWVVMLIEQEGMLRKHPLSWNS